MNELQRLRDRVEELEAVLGVTSSLPKRLFPQMRFRPKDNERLLGMLLARAFLSRDAMFDALFGARLECDQPSVKYIDVMICNLRKVLKEHGISVKNEFGKGFYITEADKSRLRSLTPGAPHEAAA